MNEAYLRKVKRHDRIARWVISCGGMAVIFSVIFILLLIVKVALPLFAESRAEVFSRYPAGMPAEEILAVGTDDYLEAGFTLDRSGTLRFYATVDGREIDQVALLPPRPGTFLLAAENHDGQLYDLLWSDGSLTLEQIAFRPEFDAAGQRTIANNLDRLAEFPAPAGVQPLRSLARVDEDGRQTRVDLLSGAELKVSQVAVSEDLLGNQTRESSEFGIDSGLPEEITALALDHGGHTLYAGTADGFLLRWDLSEPGEAQLTDRVAATADGRGVTALALVFGDVSIAVGDAGGGLRTWFPVRPEDGSPGKVLTPIHTLTPHDAAVTRILPSRRDKSLLSLDAAGRLFLDHMTSERHLLILENHLPLVQAGYSLRGDGVVGLTADGSNILWRLEVPHAEVSLQTLFGRVWYEGYDAPALVWQSSAATDDFEPKLSLTPLLFGTIKGTFYAMIFALPLALFGAIYTSQFCRPRMRAVIKPLVEIMAAIPTVIIGFLAALWLAPLIERSLGGLFLSVVLVPAGLMLALLLWQGLRRFEPLKKIERGYEFLAVMPVLLLALALAATLGPLFERLLFAGNLKLWLFQEMGARYDPRNCIIIAFAMGFAVIPIIFTIAEDALSNVPPSLKAASLAVGASRWQTVWRVMLPSASPGIFAGTMIGFGRAVGETMIVLMATGNTAIMDWSIFNGMRPLSANIAVEIPEAPVAGSLYRVLFLSAVLLFLMTFIVNTVAEVVRQRLRNKYGRF
jgi:phosphate transport system permease protein